MKRSLCSSSRGFTLLEAIVAIAVFSIGAMALYSGINSHLITLSRVDEINRKASAMDTAIEFMNTVDIVSERSGSMQFGELRVDWHTSEPLYTGDVLDEQNAPTINQSSIWDAEVTVFRDSDEVATFTMTLLGVEQVREIEDVIFN